MFLVLCESWEVLECWTNSSMSDCVYYDLLSRCLSKGGLFSSEIHESRPSRHKVVSEIVNSSVLAPRRRCPTRPNSISQWRVGEVVVGTTAQTRRRLDSRGPLHLECVRLQGSHYPSPPLTWNQEFSGTGSSDRDFVLSKDPLSSAWNRTVSWVFHDPTTEYRSDFSFEVTGVCRISLLRSLPCHSRYWLWHVLFLTKDE